MTKPRGRRAVRERHAEQTGQPLAHESDVVEIDAGVRLVDEHQDGHEEGRLPRAVRPEEDVHLPRREAEIDVVHDRASCDLHAQLLGLKHPE
jgi:hypothetical protein